MRQQRKRPETQSDLADRMGSQGAKRREDVTANIATSSRKINHFGNNIVEIMIFRRGGGHVAT